MQEWSLKNLTMASNTLLMSVASIKERTGLHSNVDEKLVLPIIKVAQDMHIRPLTGSELFDRLLQGIDNNNLTTLENGLINNYIADALCWFVMSELTPEMVYQFYNKGVVKKTDTNAQTLSSDEIIAIENKHKRYAEHYAQCLIKYLRQNMNSFPLYLNFASRQDTLKPTNMGYTTSIYLGQDNDYWDNVPLRDRYQGNGLPID